ncbi:hypothetical protein A7982_12827 [Minicystis rosea]|nr:hypothetical protein A7982_12827 [Minicystis rosea]
MRIRAIEFDGVRGLPGETYEFPPSEGLDIVAVTGGPGAGKTTFLDAIAAAKERVVPYGLPDVQWQWLVPLDQSTSRIQLTLDLSEAEQTRLRLSAPEMNIEAILGERGPRTPKPSRALQELLGTWSSDPSIGRFGYFHAERALPPPNASATPADAPVRLANDATRYARLSSIVAEGRQPALGRASRRLEEALGYTITGVAPYRGRDEIRIAKAGASPMFFSCLSATERQHVLFALAFSDPGFQDSILLLDTPELAFGDQGALDLLRRLSTWGTKNQLIVATTSQAILAALPKGRVVTLA